MSLDVVKVRQIGQLRIGALNGKRLSLLPRSPEALPLAVAGHTNPPDHRSDPVTVGNCPGECLEHQRHIALSRHQPIGVTAEGAGP